MQAAEIRKQVNELWKQAVDQLEDVKEVLSGRLGQDLVRLRSERDKLLKVLGEQTYKLANQGKVSLPGIVQRTVERLNSVLAGMQKGSRKKAAPSRKKAATKKPRKKTRAGA